MIKYSVLRVGTVRIAAVLVAKKEIKCPKVDFIVRRLESRLALPVMLVAPDEGALVGARAYAEFDSAPFLYELFGQSEIDWISLPIDFYQLAEA